MSKLFAAIRDAVLPGSVTHAFEGLEGEPDASASNPEAPPLEASPTGGDMSVQQTVAGALAAAAGANPADLAAASGGEDGLQAAMGRIVSVMSADGIKGDAGRMTAALDLAKSAPSMTAEAVTAFITAHVPASAEAPPAQPAAAQPAASQPAGGAAQSYEQQRLAAAGLAMPAAGAQGDDPVKRILGNYGMATGNTARPA